MSDSDTKQEPPYGLRMPPDLKARVKAAAATNNRSMNAEIVATLQEKYPEPVEGDLAVLLKGFLARLDEVSSREDAKALAKDLEGRMKGVKDE